MSPTQAGGPAPPDRASAPPTTGVTTADQTTEIKAESTSNPRFADGLTADRFSSVALADWRREFESVTP